MSFPPQDLLSLSFTSGFFYAFTSPFKLSGSFIKFAFYSGYLCRSLIFHAKLPPFWGQGRQAPCGFHLCRHWESPSGSLNIAPFPKTLAELSWFPIQRVDRLRIRKIKQLAPSQKLCSQPPTHNAVFLSLTPRLAEEPEVPLAIWQIFIRCWLNVWPWGLGIHWWKDSSRPRPHGRLSPMGEGKPKYVVAKKQRYHVADKGPIWSKL